MREKHRFSNISVTASRRRASVRAYVRLASSKPEWRLLIIKIDYNETPKELLTVVSCYLSKTDIINIVRFI